MTNEALIPIVMVSSYLLIGTVSGLIFFLKDESCKTIKDLLLSLFIGFWMGSIMLAAYIWERLERKFRPKINSLLNIKIKK